MEEQPAVKPPVPRRTWRRRLLRAGVFAAALGGGILLLLALIPTILYTLPTERWVASALEKRLQARVQIENLSVGWITPLSLRRFRIYEESAGRHRTLLEVDGFTTENGLLRIAFSGARAGDVSIDRLVVLVERDIAGEWNWQRILGDLLEGEEEGEPVRADRVERGERQPPGKLIVYPELALPLTRLSFDVESIEFRFRDEMTAPAREVALDRGAFRVAWAGGSSPLELETRGTVRGGGQSVPFRWDASWSGWVSGTQVRIAGSELDSTLRIERDGVAEEILSVHVAPEAARVKGGAELIFRPLSRLLRVALGSEVGLPASGRLDWQFELEEPEVDLLRVRQELNIVGLSLAGLTRDRQALPIEDAEFFIDAEVRPAAGIVERARLMADLPVITLSIEDHQSGVDSHHVTLEGSVKVAETNRLLRQLRFMPEGIPAVAGALDFSGVADYDTVAGFDRGALEMRWSGRELEFPELDLEDFPVPLRLARIDLEPTSAVVKVDVRADGPERLVLELGVENGLVDLEAGAVLEQLEAQEGRVRVDARLDAVWAYIQSVLIGLPLERLEGVVTLEQEITPHEGVLDGKGRLEVKGLMAAAEMLPGGEFRDNVEGEWDFILQMDDLSVPSFKAALHSEYLRFEALGIYDPAGTMSVATENVVHLDALWERVVLPLLGEQAFAVGGDVLLDVSATSGDGERYTFGFRSASGEGFHFDFPEFLAPVESYLLESNGVVELSGDTVGVEIESLRGELESLLSADFSVSALVGPEAGRARVVGGVLLEAEELPYLVEPLLVTSGVTGIELAGGSRVELELEGAWEMAAEGVLLLTEPARVRVGAESAFEAVMLEHASGMALEMDGFSDARTVDVEVRSLEPLTVSVEESSQLLIDGLGVGVMALLEGVRLETAVSVDFPDRVDVGKLLLGFEGVEFATPAAEGYVPRTMLESRVGYSLAEETVELESLAISIPDFLDAEFSGEFSLGSQSGSVKGVGSLRTPEETEIALAGDDGWQGVEWTGGGGFSLEGWFRMPEDGGLAGIFPGDYAGGSVRLSAEDLGVWLGEAMSVEGVSGALGITLQEQGGVMELSGTVGGVEQEGEELVVVDGFRVSTAVQFLRNGDLRMFLDELRVPVVGSGVRGQLRFDNFQGFVERAAENPGAENVTRRLLEYPFSLEYSFDQDFRAATAMVEGADAGGRMVQIMSLANVPGRELSLNWLGRVEGVGFGQPGGMRLERLGTQYRIRKVWHSAGVANPAANHGRGTLSIGVFDLGGGFQTPALERALGSWAQMGNRATGEVLVESLFGGPASFRTQTAWEDGRLVTRGEFAITGLDGASFLPGLVGRRISRRSLSAFGSFSVPLAADTTPQSLIDQTTLRLDVTEFGSDLLREYLRAFDGGGMRPAIQNTLVALNFAVPTRAIFQMRNGLVDLSVELQPRAGPPYNFPVFQRVPLSALAGRFLAPEMEAQLALLHRTLWLLSASTQDDLLDSIREWSAP